MIDLQPIKNSYQNIKLNSNSIIKSEFMLTDQLITIKPIHLLTTVFDTGITDHPAEQSINYNRTTEKSVKKELA